MSDVVTISLITGGFGLLNTLINYRTHTRMSLLEKNTNSIKDELVKVTGEAEHAKGVIEGKNDVS